MAAKPLIVDVPWPAPALSPNARVHWSKVAKAKKRSRHECWALAHQAGAPAWGSSVPSDEMLDVHLDFWPPDAQVRDDANAMAQMKSGVDGIADALGIDDSMFRTSYTLHKEVVGVVRVTIKRAEAA